MTPLVGAITVLLLVTVALLVLRRYRVARASA